MFFLIGVNCLLNINENKLSVVYDKCVLIE